MIRAHPTMPVFRRRYTCGVCGRHVVSVVPVADGRSADCLVVCSWRRWVYPRFSGLEDRRERDEPLPAEWEIRRAMQKIRRAS